VRSWGGRFLVSFIISHERRRAGETIIVFTTLFGEVCEKFNISVPVLGVGGMVR
jgi:hypothetical protein